MKRKVKQFLNLSKRLDAELEKSSDIFLKQRPWLADSTYKSEILSRTEEESIQKIENDIAIEEIQKELRIWNQ